MAQFEEYKPATVGENTTPCQVNETNSGAVADYITQWLKDYVNKSGTKGFVMGVSGGIDSAVVSTLCARTGFPLTVVEMPIHQDSDQVTRAKNHIQFLKDNYDNVTSMEIDLTNTYDMFYDQLLEKSLEQGGVEMGQYDGFEFTMANTRSRLRMTTLYSIAGINGLLVCGTGNRVEDFGIGFYTKYGDGGVDISPIGDLMKTEVYEVAKALGVNQEIINAKPTDGLHGDSRTDEDQIGATYPELEWAMEYVDDYTQYDETGQPYFDDREAFMLNEREKEVLAIYLSFHNNNKHKMEPIPVCGIPTNILD
jgi:NAD+ synthase